MKKQMGLLIGILFLSTGLLASDWSDKRVNQHLQRVGTKIYHQNKVGGAMNRNVETDAIVNGLDIPREPESDLSGLELEGTSYEVDAGMQPTTYYIDSPVDEVADNMQDRFQAERHIIAVQKRYLRDVKSALREAGINAEIDENLQVYSVGD